MFGQGPVSAWQDGSSSAEPPAGSMSEGSGGGAPRAEGGRRLARVRDPLGEEGLGAGRSGGLCTEVRGVGDLGGGWDGRCGSRLPHCLEGVSKKGDWEQRHRSDCDSRWTASFCPERALRNLLEKLSSGHPDLYLHRISVITYYLHYIFFNKSAGQSYYQNSKGSDGIKDGHKMNNIAKLQDSSNSNRQWFSNLTRHLNHLNGNGKQIQLHHPDHSTGWERHLCGIAKICDANYLRVILKRQYMHMIQRNSQKQGRCPHSSRGRLNSDHFQKQHYPCTVWRHQLEREDSGPSSMAAASAPEIIIQHSLWRPVRTKGGLKTGYVSKTRCKWLKIFRKSDRLFMQVSTNDFESHMDEEKKEDVLSKCMQSIEEQGEHLMLTCQSCLVYRCAQGRSRG
ncbi:LOW QUALITY PROTEIN: protein FAM216A [Rhynchonycteris naso]